MADLKMEGLIDHLAKLLGKQFAGDVSQIYFGDNALKGGECIWLT